MGFREGLDVSEKRQVSCPYRDVVLVNVKSISELLHTDRRTMTKLIDALCYILLRKLSKRVPAQWLTSTGYPIPKHYCPTIP